MKVEVRVSRMDHGKVQKMGQSMETQVYSTQIWTYFELVTKIATDFKMKSGWFIRREVHKKIQVGLARY